MFRVLKPVDRMLLFKRRSGVIGGMISAEEIMTRRSIGFYVYQVRREITNG